MIAMRRFMLVALALIALLGLFTAAPYPSVTGPRAVQAETPTQVQSRGVAAMEEAAKSNKYLFIFFWKKNDGQARTMHGVFQSAMVNMTDSADSVGIQTTDPGEKPVVDKFGVSRAPMPLVLALAPNGAVTKGFPIKFDENQFRQAFVSPCTARCLKALQDRKLVVLCVQNQKTQFSQVAWKGAQDFKTDARFAKATEVVTLDPDDRTEAAFLRDLQVDPQTSQAVTVLLAPPGQPIAKFAGAVTKDQIVAKVASAQSDPCAGGKCGPGGCSPKK